VPAHRIKKGEYEELPELTDEMLARAKINKGGRSVSEIRASSSLCGYLRTLSSVGRLRGLTGKLVWQNA
jgi:hypothetical protein